MNRSKMDKSKIEYDEYIKQRKKLTYLMDAHYHTRLDFDDRLDDLTERLISENINKINIELDD